MIAASTKPACLIVDFVGNSGRHKLVTSLEILGGNMSPDDDDEAEARRRVAAKAASGEAVNTLEELEKMRAEIQSRKLVDAEQRKFIQAQAAYSVRSVNPFDVFDLAPVSAQERKTNRIQLSWKQREILRNRLRINPDTVAPSEGRALIDEYFRRMNAKMSTFGQMKYLRKHGYPVPMSFVEASATINWLMGGKVA